MGLTEDEIDVLYGELREQKQRDEALLRQALEDARLFKIKDAASYWLVLIGRAEGNTALGCSLIAAMDNPPVIMGDERVER